MIGEFSQALSAIMLLAMPATLLSSCCAPVFVRVSKSLMAPALGDTESNPEAANIDMRFDEGQEKILDEPWNFFGRARSLYSQRNGWGINRDLIDQRTSFTGLPGVHLEDQAVTESMGGIVDRTQEHLGTSDKMIIQTRIRLIKAAKASTSS